VCEIALASTRRTGHYALVLRCTIVLMLVLTSCTTDQGAVAPSTGPDGQPLIAANAQLNCDGQIRQDASPPDNFEIVDDVVAFRTSTSDTTALQTAQTQIRDPAERLYAKSGLEIRGGAVAEIIVPERMLGRVSLRWGGRPTSHLTIGRCAADGAWVVFPGGYLVPEVGCFDIVVRSANVDHQVSVGVGAPCPGQSPPVVPTEV
jgi:hypothetical protein